MDDQIAVSEKRQRIRKKLGPGKGLLDWIKLCRNFKQQSTIKQTISVTFDELQKHNTENDCWTAFRGDVYDITCYLPFHPGGHIELMKAAGTDCTEMFNQVHSHVNLSSMLVTFKVGTLTTFSPLSSPSKLCLSAGSTKTGRKLSLPMKIAGENSNHEDVADGVSVSSPVGSIDVKRIPPTPTLTIKAPLFQHFTNEDRTSNSIAIPEARSRRSSREQKDQPNVKYNWHQTEKDVDILFTGQNVVFNIEDIVLHTVNCVFEAKILLGNWCYNMNIALENPVKRSKVLLIETGLQITLEKSKEAIWDSLGVLLPGNVEMTPRCGGMYYMTCSVKTVESVNYNTKIFTLELPGASHMVVPTGHHVRVKAKDRQGEWVERSYTPVLPLVDSYHSEEAEVKLMVKLYSNGAMSSILSSLQTGDTVELSLPMGNFSASLLDTSDHVILIAAGSGFTPMIKLIRKVCLRNCEIDLNQTTIKVLFFNKTVEDILWWDKLQSLSEQSPNFTVEHILSRGGSDWTGTRGRVSRYVLQDHMSPFTDNQLICVCGPTEFTQQTVSILLDMGFNENNMHVFE